jgi:uncharacterized membrane protein YraQ (UPF0718 family)
MIYTLMLLGLSFSVIKSKKKTMKAFKVAKKSLIKTAPSLLTVLGIVGLTMGALNPEVISKVLGAESGLLGTVFAAVIGGITLIPSIVAFPLAGSLLASGAGINTIAVFITTLVMVGVVTAPMEIEYLGKKFTFLRNGFSFLMAIGIGLLMEVIL